MARANVQIAAQDLGTGAYTVIGQMAAESLGIPLSSVTLSSGTANYPPAPVAGGSNTTASACSAVMKGLPVDSSQVDAAGRRSGDRRKRGHRSQRAQS